MHYPDLPIASRLALLDNVPVELRARPHWVGFQLDQGEKRPVIAPDGKRLARCNGPSTWRPFNTAVEGMCDGRYPAIAYALTGTEIVGDLDRCLNGYTPNDHARRVMESLPMLRERSVSGEGLHLWGAGVWGKGMMQPGYEVYGRGRFIITTGDLLPGSPTDLRAVVAEEVLEVLGQRSVVTESELGDRSVVTCNVLPPGDVLGVDSLIQQTQPRQYGERNRRLFDLARGLRWDMRMDGSDPTALLPIVERWHRLALPNIRTKPFGITWQEFLGAWRSARSGLVCGALHAAIVRADASQTSPVAERYAGTGIRRLAAVCWQLAQNADHRFFLSTYTIARILGRSQQYAHCLMKTLVADGVLGLVATGDRRLASEYRWIATHGRETVRDGERRHGMSKDTDGAVDAPESQSRAATEPVVIRNPRCIGKSSPVKR